MNQRDNNRIARAAARGALWLDKNMPGWSRKIRRRKLDLDQCDVCILGQLYGGDDPYGFEKMVDRLGLTDEQVTRLGFTLGMSDLSDDDDDPDAWPALTDAWRDELKVRPR